MLSGTRTCTAREPSSQQRGESATLAHQPKGRKGEEASFDRFRHASFVEGTSFISTRLGEGGKREGVFLSRSSLPLSVPIVFGDEKKRRQIPQARGQPLDRRRRRFCASRSRPRSLTALFERGPRARREAVEKRGKTTR